MKAKEGCLGRIYDILMVVGFILWLLLYLLGKR